MKKTLALLLLCLCLLLHGCTLSAPAPTDASTADSGQTAAAQQTGSEIPQRLCNGGLRDYLPAKTIQMTSFDRLAYTRPDTRSLYDTFDRLTAAVEDGADADTILNMYYPAYDRYYSFYTMDAMANIRYSADTTDSFYRAEYDFCEAAAPEVEKRLEAFYKACAQSPERQALEQACFGQDYFVQYDDYSLYTNEEYLALARQEEALLAQYRAAVESPIVFYDGRQQNYADLLRSARDYETYYSILQAYYSQYNPSVGAVYLALIRVRGQIAQCLGYDTYADYCYDSVYERDYTPLQGADYIAQVRRQLVPVFQALAYDDEFARLQYAETDSDGVFTALKQAAASMGGTAEEAFRFMEAYDLYDIAQSDRKADTSFTTYLYSYEAPYLLLDAQGTEEDFLTFAHEFGHFADAYAHYHGQGDLETAETFSQAMEYLALFYLQDAPGSSSVQSLQRLKLADTLETFVTQAAFADFENRVYALPDDGLTLEAVNRIYRQIAKDYGFYTEEFDFYYSQAWIDVPHFFESPYYVISYCLSADAALQICRLEAETPGSGLEKYNELLNMNTSDGLQAVLTASGLENPLKVGKLEEISGFFRQTLNLKTD